MTMSHDQRLIDCLRFAQQACADVLSVAPLRSDAETQALANASGAHFETTVAPSSVVIDLVAGETRARVFGCGAVATFDAGDGQ